MKKDYLTQAILAPEKQRMRITQFDHRTQQDAFAVSLEGLKGVCVAFPIFVLFLVSPVECHHSDRRISPSKRGSKEAGVFLLFLVNLPAQIL